MTKGNTHARSSTTAITNIITEIKSNQPFIFLNIIGINSPIKKYRLTKWKEKQDPSTSTSKYRHYLRVKVWEKTFQANVPKK